MLQKCMIAHACDFGAQASRDLKYSTTSVIATSSPLSSPAASLPTCCLILTVPFSSSAGARMATNGTWSSSATFHCAGAFGLDLYMNSA